MQQYASCPESIFWTILKLHECSVLEPAGSGTPHLCFYPVVVNPGVCCFSGVKPGERILLDNLGMCDFTRCFEKVSHKSINAPTRVYPDFFYSKNCLKLLTLGKVMVNDSWAAPTRAAYTINDSSFHLYQIWPGIDEFCTRLFSSLLLISGLPPPPCSLSRTIIFTDMKASTYSALSYRWREGGKGRSGKGNVIFPLVILFINFYAFQLRSMSYKMRCILQIRKGSRRQLFEENKYENW